MDRHRRIRNDFDRFADSMRLAGFSTYADYIASPQWREFNAWYRSIGELPQGCLVCKNETFVLHHWNYSRVGFEWPSDVVPLCEDHHHQLHRWLQTSDQLRNVARCLIECFGMSSEDALVAYFPTARFAERMKVAGLQSPKRQPAGFSRVRKLRDGGIELRPIVLLRRCDGCGKDRPQGAFMGAGNCSVCKRRAAKAAKKPKKDRIEFGRTRWADRMPEINKES